MNTQTEVTDDRVLRNMSKGDPQTRPNRPTKPRHRPSDIRTHRAVNQRRSVGNGAKGGRPTPPGSLQGWVLAGSLILSSQWWFGIFPCLEMTGTDLSSYKRGLPPLCQHTPLGSLCRCLPPSLLRDTLSSRVCR